jgi:sulfur carrier protein
MLRLVINGEHHTVTEVKTLVDLLAVLGIAGRLAVEINGEIVPRSRYATCVLHDDDIIEVVRAIGGG